MALKYLSAGCNLQNKVGHGDFQHDLPKGDDTWADTSLPLSY